MTAQASVLFPRGCYKVGLGMIQEVAFLTSSKLTGIIVPQGPYSENHCPFTAVVMWTRSLSNSLSISLGNKSSQDDPSVE